MTKKRTTRDVRKQVVPRRFGCLALLGLLVAALACGGQTAAPASVAPTPSVTAPAADPTPITRLASIPADAVKMTPADDAWQPVAASGWSDPAPLDAPINTAGGEDSPFITPDGQTFYFFFTPDVRVPPEKQLLDGVTGIWSARRTGAGWSEPERVVLAQPGEFHLDGCPFVLGDWMAFCSARVGNYRDVDLYTAAWRDGAWTDWQNWGEQLNVEYEAGEMHVSADGQRLYFGSGRAGGSGGRDLWVSTRTGEGWGPPLNLGAPINTEGDEDRPFVSPDGQELWFDGTSRKGRPGPAVFRSLRQPDGAWGAPEEIVSTFAGEPTLAADGRMLYFTHHYFTADLSRMIEADIYATTRP
jgi:hypothetical protein